MVTSKLGVLRSLTLIALLWLTPQTQAAELSAQAQTEIQQLLSALENSGCQFNRNDRLYDGADARKHLQRKLDYLQDHMLIQSAEDFIRDGASTSSSSGKAYQVHCQGAPAVPSQQWLLSTLEQLRAANKK